MENMVKDLHEMCETLARALKEANEKLRNAGGKVSAADMEYIDRLTHGLKSIKATIAMIESEENDGYNERGYSRDRYSDRMYGRSYDDGHSYRGRGSYAKRDSMGRYASDDGYSRGGMIDELRELMNSAPDQQTRDEMQRLIQKMEQR